MTPTSELRSKARGILKGKWKFAVGAGFLAFLLGGTGENLGSICINTSDKINQYLAYQTYGYRVIDPPMDPSVFPLFVFGLVCSLILIVISGATMIGYSRLNLSFVDGTPLSLRQVVSEYPRMLRGIAMSLLMVLYILLWSLLLIVPGIIAALSYTLTPYLMAEYKDIGANEAITLSKKMMHGYKEDLFFLYLSFIGWYVLSILTLGLGGLWLGPYVSVSEAAFYREVSQKYWEQNPNPYQPTLSTQETLTSSKQDPFLDTNQDD